MEEVLLKRLKRDI